MYTKYYHNKMNIKHMRKNEMIFGYNQVKQDFNW